MSNVVRMILTTLLSSIGDDVLVPIFRRVLHRAKKFVANTENEIDNTILDLVIGGLEDAVNNDEAKPKSKSNDK